MRVTPSTEGKYLKGVGPHRAELLAKRGIHTFTAMPPGVAGTTSMGSAATVAQTDSASAAQAMTAATHHAVEQHTGGPANNANATETRSLDELAARLSRLPGNTDPEQAALIYRWVEEAAHQFNDARVQVFVPILVEHIVRGRLYKMHADRDAGNTH